jgi:ABC-2 type transport system permease protein
MMLLSLATICAMTAGVTAISVGVGALYPNFAFENAAQVPTSFGGAVCMIFSLAFIAATVTIQASPMYLLAMRGLRTKTEQVPELAVLAPAFVALLTLTAIAIAVPLRLGFNKLERLRD